MGSTRIASPAGNPSSRDLHISLGRPLISALQQPHFAALQFQRTARSFACVRWISRMASSTTIPTSAAISYSTKPPPELSPRQTSNRRVLTSAPRPCAPRRAAASSATRTAGRSSTCMPSSPLLTTRLCSRQWPSYAGWSSRLCAPRLSVRRRAQRVIASAQVRRLPRSRHRFHAGLNARPPARAHPLGAQPKALELGERGREPRLVPKDAHELLHGVLQVGLDAVRVFTVLVEQREHLVDGSLHLRSVRRPCGCRACEPRGPLTRPSAEDQEIGERVARPADWRRSSRPSTHRTRTARRRCSHRSPRRRARRP